ncbi:MAG: hypothetical protein AB1638_03270 [Nitrospirota bacterium]
MSVAEEILEMYPSIKADLFETLGWKVDFRPIVQIDKEGDILKKTTGSKMFVAYAVPKENLIVLDSSRVYAKPFSLESTLKHELCHLLLHRNIEGLPRWFDEGVCQWASGGIWELMAEDSERTLHKATLTGRLMGIEKLSSFPPDDLTLAYEESKSIVEYINREFDKQGILQVLNYLKEGYSLDESFQRGLSISTSELEVKWRGYLKRKYTWGSYLSHNLYGILFLIAALATTFGFIRMLKKKREYKDKNEEDDIEYK